jgi:Na+-translocating ferredoxin:NAD+ oxidoreductase subunit B
MFAGTMILTVSVSVVVGILAAWLASSRGDAVTDTPQLTLRRINAVLPQTQCRQCGYAGCAPYAEAIV